MPYYRLSSELSFFSTCVSVAVTIFTLYCWWKIFEKADEPGWNALIPFYSTYKMFKISYGSGWLFLLLLVPLVNVFLMIMLPFRIARAFNRSTAFGFGLLFLPVIFYGLMAFASDVEYYGPY